MGMHVLLRGGAVTAAGLWLAGCSSLITGGDLIRPGEATGTLQVVNGTSNYIDTIAISECNASTYGLDRLPDDVSLAPGEYYEFTVSAGCWDVDAGSFGVGEAKHRMDVEAYGVTRYTVTD